MNGRTGWRNSRSGSPLGSLRQLARFCDQIVVGLAEAREDAAHAGLVQRVDNSIRRETVGRLLRERKRSDAERYQGLIGQLGLRR